MTGKKYDQTRCANIGQSRLAKLSDEQAAQMKALLELGMPDGHVMEKLAISARVYKRYKASFYPDGIPWQIKWLEKDIESSVVEEIIELSKKKYRYKRIARLIGLGQKTVKLVLLALNKKDDDIKLYSYDDDCWSQRKESTPEKCVRVFLESRQIDFRQEVQLEPNSKWFFDFHIVGTNLMVEVQGDYWHCNPAIYAEPINNYQRWARRRDFAKRDYAKKLGYKVLPLWENDLSKFQNETLERLERETKRCKVEQ